MDRPFMQVEKGNITIAHGKNIFLVEAVSRIILNYIFIEIPYLIPTTSNRVVG